ncbi:hypothetical protein HYH03_010965 [Edaphochlamys debaryana]|uniref:Uncharacterized protein n=1 Tax=Edaphochlamys debaryana TaxID=47281 RepID=A0A836BVE9_9CHLO|nr:hypothetical protein HYH03_010965 [Edaphochlamys debaryana]|eukprot:KAG2490571.1 hypothetical protein HYH03_010965 [Edaphochlamys debaryana]
MVFNSLLWGLAMPAHTLWLDRLCSWATAAAALVTAVALGAEPSPPEALRFRPWAVALQAVAAAAALTGLHAWAGRLRTPGLVRGHSGTPQPELGPRSVAVAGGVSVPAAVAAHSISVSASLETGCMRYEHAVLRCAVHVRLRGLQPEQLGLGWRERVERGMAALGWCLLNASVRRGSICISFTAARLRRPGAGGGGPSGAASARPADGGAPADEGDAELPQLDLLSAGPDSLIVQLGLQRETLPPGFSLTVQAVSDDQRCCRVRYRLLPGGDWSVEALEEGNEGGGEAALEGAADTNAAAEAAAGTGLGAAAGLEGAAADGGTAAESRDRADELGRAGPEAEPPEARQGQGQAGPAAGRAGSRLPWELRAPLVVEGEPEGQAPAGPEQAPRPGAPAPGGGARYSMTVRVSQTGAPGAGAGHAAAMSDVQFRARPLGVQRGLGELAVRQRLLSSSSADGSGSGPVHSTWSLTVWDRHATNAVVDGAAAAAPPAAAGPDPAPRLLDLSLWRGHDLLSACVILLVPPRRATGGGGGSGRPGGRAGAAAASAGAAGSVDPWVCELRLLLGACGRTVAQRLLVDIGLLLSGGIPLPAAALAPAPAPAPSPVASGEGAQGVPGAVPLIVSTAAGEPLAAGGGTASGSGPAGSGPRAAGAAGLMGNAQRAVIVLDMGCVLLSLVLQQGACGLAARLWSALGALGYSGEELLLHSAAAGSRLGPGGAGSGPGQAAGAQGALPLLHAALRSGSVPATDLVLSWYDAAGLPEPWLQPFALFPGRGVLLSPLVLAAAAAAPAGRLLRHILRTRPRAAAAWRVRVGGASGRSAALAARLWLLVLEQDARAATAPAVAAVASAVGWAGRRLGAAAGVLGLGRGRARANGAEAPETKGRGTAALAAAAAPVGKQGAEAEAEASVSGVALATGGRFQRHPLQPDLDTFVARRTQARMRGWQLFIVVFQVLAQLKVLSQGFDAACPAAAAAVAAARGGAWTTTGLHATGALGWCLASRYWWTGLELGLWLALWGKPSARRHAVLCAVRAVLSYAYQAHEGGLLPSSGMSAFGAQLIAAHILWIVVSAACFQTSVALSVPLRIVEGLGAARMYVAYGVAHSSPRTATLLSLAMNLGLGCSVAYVLRARAARELVRQLQEQEAEERGEGSGHESARSRTGEPCKED